jgi:RNA polymerase sigma factor (sigma-70 family)
MSETAATDLQLLAHYTRDHAEDAFAEIVRRHIDLVHSAALRQVRSPQLAEEVAQSAFTDLARNAHRLAPDTIVTAWLYQVTRRTAIDVVRREARRQLREQIATEMNAMNATTADWTHIEPLLDEAMHALDDTDRAAVLLRYFENKSLREVGATLGTSDDAAQKRVSRAVERLREFFAKRGVTVGASGLVVVISGNAVQAAPAGLTVTISTAAALAGTTIGATTIATLTKTIAMTTLQKTIVGAALVAALGTGIHQARQAARLRAEITALRNETHELGSLREENGTLTAKLARQAERRELSRTEFLELMRLRGQVALLRREVSEFKGERTKAGQARATAPVPRPDWQWPAGQFIPREQWLDAGFAKPEATIQTVLWAMAAGAGDKFVSAFSAGNGPDAEDAGKLLDRMQFTMERFFKALGATVHSVRAEEDDRSDVMLNVTWADESKSHELLILRRGDDGTWRITGGASEPDASKSLFAGPDDR